MVKELILKGLRYRDTHQVIWIKDGEGSMIEAETMNGKVILRNQEDERVSMAERVIARLKQACVYFSPECENYMNQMQLYVVHASDINAFSSIGGIIVVYTGLIDHFIELQNEGKIKDVETVILR